MHLANRLDSETSGLIMVARNEEMAGKLGSALQDKKIRKEYLAITMGVPPENQGWIRAPIKGRREHLCHVYEPHPKASRPKPNMKFLKKKINIVCSDSSLIPEKRISCACI